MSLLIRLYVRDGLKRKAESCFPSLDSIENALRNRSANYLLEVAGTQRVYKKNSRARRQRRKSTKERERDRERERERSLYVAEIFL